MQMCIFNVCQKPLEQKWSIRKFLPPSYFRCMNKIVSLPLYNVEALAKPFRCPSNNIVLGGGRFYISSVA